MGKEQIDWAIVFNENRRACYELYKWWNHPKPTIQYANFLYGHFLDMLIRSGYIEINERIFEFFDSIYIRCYVVPTGLRYFSGCCESEHRTIKCHDYDSRHEAVKRVIENAFDLLGERIRYM